jgi:hypothetical protein
MDSEDESDATLPQTARQTRSSSNFIRSVDSSRRKHRRVGTGFDGSYSSSDGSEPEEETVTPSKKKLKRTPTEAKKTPTKTPTKAKTVVISESEEAEPAMAMPTRSTRKNQRQKSVTLSDTSEDEIAMSGPRSSQRQKYLRNGKGSQSSPRATTSSQKRGKKPVVESESDDDEDDIRSSPQKRHLSRLAIPDDEVEDEDEDDEDGIPSPRKYPQKATVDTDDEDCQPIISPLKRLRQAVESDDSDIVSSPLKRRRSEPQEDEDSNDSDLPSPTKIPRSAKRDSSSKTPPRFTRQQKTARRHRTEKEKKMELLKRRRAGENIEQVTDSESESEEDNSDEELQELSEFEDEEESPEQVRNPTKRTNRNRKQGSDSEDDFIVEDDEGPLGIPDHLAQIPLEFTHAAHKPIKEHFRDVVEWMVHNKVNPGFVWDDPVYTTAFQKVDAECGGFADSKFVSTQWTAEFTKAVYARPVLLIRDLLPGEGIDVLGEAKCEACNHRKHTPSFALQFTGKAYHKNTLEEVDQESSDEDSNDNDEDSQDSDKVSVDENHKTLPSEDKQWFAGR